MVSLVLSGEASVSVTHGVCCLASFLSSAEAMLVFPTLLPSSPCLVLSSVRTQLYTPRGRGAALQSKSIVGEHTLERPFTETQYSLAT